MPCDTAATNPADNKRISAPLKASLEQVSSLCTSCMLCVKECRFLQRYGTPKQIAVSFDPTRQEQLAMPFECSLCGLCSAVCPEPIDPAAMFIQMRREAVVRGNNHFFEYGGLLAYERKGTSRRYSWYGLPAGCETIFFPGCALPGSRPDQTVKVYSALQAAEPTLGIVFDCCTKPSHDLGRSDYFSSMFDEMKDYLLSQGVKRVLVACPNCLKMFREYAPELAAATIYEVLATGGMASFQFQIKAPSSLARLQLLNVLFVRLRRLSPRRLDCISDLKLESGRLSGTVTIHDPCVVRLEMEAQAAVRSLVTAVGLTLAEMPHSGKTTLCCGEGGAVACLEPEFAEEWGRQRKEEAAGRRMITYCAGCTHTLNPHTPTSHIIDLLFDGEAALAGQTRVSRAPFTYLNRLGLKKRFRKKLAGATTRERTFSGGGGRRGGGIVKPLIFISLLVAVIAAVRLTGASQYLEQEKLRALIEGYGSLAPLIYMLVYAVAPSLFLPGLPITIVGGILFGPVWGVIYTIVGATAGACIAFLVARYIARSWVTSKLTSPRWRKLDQEVEKHGWKVVAFTRLIPLFPFNLLNYAFGLTSVRFSHYAIATFVFMLPACIAFIVFSSSFLDLLNGRISPTFLVGLALVVLISMIPALYRRYQRKRTDVNDDPPH